MITGVKKDQHWLADYSYIPLAFAAPRLLGFTNEKAASTATKVLGATALGYSLLTDAKWGAYKLIPYKTHAVLDLVHSTAAIVLPWALKFSDNKKARNTVLALGLVGLTVGVLSLIGNKYSKD